MKKNTMNKNIKQLKKLSSKMPRTINEAINFNEVDDMDMNMEDDDFSSEKQLSAPKMDDNSEMGAEELLSDIRKKALKAMANLADTPEDPNYEVLKKIFMMLDKGVTEKQEQREVMAKNPNLNR
jgi:hypothetical protein